MKTLRLLLAATALLAACDSPDPVTPSVSPRYDATASGASAPQPSPTGTCDTTCNRFPQVGSGGG